MNTNELMDRLSKIQELENRCFECLPPSDDDGRTWLLRLSNGPILGVYHTEINNCLSRLNSLVKISVQAEIDSLKREIVQIVGSDVSREFGRLGGEQRAEKYGHEQLSEWGKLGGRPKKIDGTPKPPRSQYRKVVSMLLLSGPSSTDDLSVVSKLGHKVTYHCLDNMRIQGLATANSNNVWSLTERGVKLAEWHVAHPDAMVCRADLTAGIDRGVA